MPSPKLTQIIATWTTPASEDSWLKLVSLSSMQREGGDVLAIGPSLSDEGEDRIASAAVFRKKDDSNEFGWALVISSPSSNDPSEKVQEADKAIGGRKGMSTLLAENLSRSAPAVGDFRIEYSIPESSFRCHNLPVSVENGGIFDAALSLGAARLEQVGYRFDGGAASGIEEVAIIYLHREKAYRLIINAKGLLKFNASRWLPFADDVFEIALGTFFVSTEVAE